MTAYIKRQTIPNAQSLLLVFLKERVRNCQQCEKKKKGSAKRLEKFNNKEFISGIESSHQMHELHFYHYFMANGCRAQICLEFQYVSIEQQKKIQ